MSEFRHTLQLWRKPRKKCESTSNFLLFVRSLCVCFWLQSRSHFTSQISFDQNEVEIYCAGRYNNTPNDCTVSLTPCFFLSVSFITSSPIVYLQSEMYSVSPLSPPLRHPKNLISSHLSPCLCLVHSCTCPYLSARAL